MSGGIREELLPLPGTSQFPVQAPFDRTFVFDGVPVPGKWTLISAKKVFGWKVQMGMALDGGHVYPAGDPLVVVKFKGEFWSSSDFGVYTSISRPALFTKPSVVVGGIAAASSIEHPELAALGVTAVVVLEVNPVIQQEGGLWTTEIEFLQYRPPIPVKPAPKQVIPPGPKGGFNVPTKTEAEEQTNTATIEALSAQKANLLK